MNRTGGFTLIELVISMSIAATGIAAGTTLLLSQQMSSRAAEQAFARSAVVSEGLCLLADDLRRTVEVHPRIVGQGLVLVLSDGSAVAYYPPRGRPEEIRRKRIEADGRAGPPRVVAREVTRLAVVTEGDLFVAWLGVPGEERSIAVRRRHAPE